MSTFMDRDADGRSVILVGIDFSETSMGALRAAENLARYAPNSELHLVHAFGWPTVTFGSREVVASSQLGFTEDLDRARAPV